MKTIHYCIDCGKEKSRKEYKRCKKCNVIFLRDNPPNYNENNLITLCKQCNIRANYNRKYWEEYYKKKILKMDELK